MTLHASQRYAGEAPATASLTLTYDQRQKRRFRATLDDTRCLSVLLEHGTTLRDGDKLATTDGEIIVVHAAAEELSVVRSADAWLLSRAAYHLGNRHTPLQILPSELRYNHDHVLDDLVRQLGLEPECERLPFEPEAGAYGHGHSFTAHHHGSRHSHTHDHDTPPSVR